MKRKLAFWLSAIAFVAFCIATEPTQANEGCILTYAELEEAEAVSEPIPVAEETDETGEGGKMVAGETPVGQKQIHSARTKSEVPHWETFSNKAKALAAVGRALKALRLFGKEGEYHVSIYKDVTTHESIIRIVPAAASKRG